MITSRPWLLTKEVRGAEYEGTGASAAYADGLLELDEQVQSSDSVFLSVKEAPIAWIEGVLTISF